MMRNNRFKLLTTALAAALIGLGGGLSACAPTTAQRGNILQDYQLAEVKPGESTRSDVLRALGSPTTQSPFDETIWYYIGQNTEKHGIMDPEVTEERIVVVAFNQEGVVEHIADVDNDRIDVPYSRERTPTHGNEMTIMQQFLGNLGKFNPQESSGPVQ